MASVSRFLPNFQSEFANEAEGDSDLTLNLISLLRIELPSKELRIPAGATLSHRQVDSINHGANIISFNVTPEEYAGLYSADQIKERDIIQLEEIKNLSVSSGLPLSPSLI
jgi:biotin synthase-like enzyme